MMVKKSICLQSGQETITSLVWTIIKLPSIKTEGSIVHLYHFVKCSSGDCLNVTPL